MHRVSTRSPIGEPTQINVQSQTPPSLALPNPFGYARLRLAGVARGRPVISASMWWPWAEAPDFPQRFAGSGPARSPAYPDAAPAWGLRGGEGFTKVRSTEADHVGPASGRNANY